MIKTYLLKNKIYLAQIFIELITDGQNLKLDEQYIKVKNSSDIKIKRNWTKNGPVLPSSVFDLSSITPKHHVAALSWTV